MKNFENFAVIGHPFGKAGNVTGCNEAPEFLRKNGLIQKLQAVSPTVVDIGDTTIKLDAATVASLAQQISEHERTANNVIEVYSACATLYKKTFEALQNGRRPLILGGDHSLSIGSFAAAADFSQKTFGKPLGLLWIDTHPDLNTPETSPSMNIFGMSVAVLLGLMPGLLSSLAITQPALKAQHLAYVALRDVDPGEKQRIKQLGIKAYTIEDIDKRGMYNVIQEAIAHVSNQTAGFVASFDLDVCDPKIAPAVGTPIRGGLTYRESHLIMETIFEHTQKLLGLEFVELNPSLDINSESIELSISLLASALGKTLL